MSGADPTPPVDAPKPDGPAYLDAALRAVFASKGEKRLTSPPAGGESHSPGGLGRRYALDSEIARGGMGVIYEVRDHDFGRVRAMKMLRAEVKGGAASNDTPRGVEKRFLEEARLTTQLGHPGIVPVHDLGFDAEGRPYFTMDRVKGRTLAEVFDALRAREAGWNLSRVVGVLVKACQAVAYAHSKSVVHRDLKPTNVMVGKYGEVYVMDWGLAKVLGRPGEEPPGETVTAPRARDDAGALETQTILQSDDSLPSLEGLIAGTPAYMSPEQARGAASEVDQLSDVYSIGAILYHLLTGTPPYLGDGDRWPSQEVLKRVREGPPRPVHQLAPGAPPELVAICGKTMCREKAGRYAACFDLAEDLQAYLDNRVVQAHRTGALAEARAWIRRNRSTALTAAAALLALAGAAVGVVVAQWRHNDTLSRQVYSYDLSRAVSALNARNTDSLLSLLEGCPVKYRGWEWRRLRHLATFAHQVFSGHQPGTRIRSVAAHPDGTRFASGGEDNTVRIWDLRDGRCLGALWEHTVAIRSLAYGRAGTVLAAGAFDGTVQIFTTQISEGGSGAILMRLEEVSPVVCVRFDPDQERLVTADLNGAVKVWGASTGELLRTLLTDQSRVYDVAISPDGKWMAAATVREAVRVWEFESGRLVHELHLEAFSLCFQRAPEVKLLWAGVNARLVCLDLQSGALVESINLNKGSVSSISSSTDGAKLVVTDAAARLIDLQRRDSRPLVLVHELGLAYGPGAITSDGETMISATQDGLLCAWKVSGLGQRVIVEPEPLAKWGVATQPAGRLIAAACWDGTAPPLGPGDRPDGEEAHRPPGRDPFAAVRPPRRPARHRLLRFH